MQNFNLLFHGREAKDVEKEEKRKKYI